MFYSCAKMLFFYLGIANKISMLHLSHFVSHTHTHTRAFAYKNINASRNSHTFYFLVYKPVGCASGFWSPIDQF